MNKKFLEKLLETPSPSGLEKLGLEVWDEEMTCSGFDQTYADKAGNSGYSIGNGPCRVLISGHIDEICMAVQYITDEGFLVPVNMGGIDRKVLPGRNVIVLKGYDADSGTVEGIVHKNAVHIEYPEESQNDAIRLSDLRIDIGAESREEVENNYDVHVGSIIVPGRHINLEFGKNKIHGNSLDDKIGVFVVSEVLKRLKGSMGEWSDKYTVIGMACIGEESGLLGAHRAAHQVNPDISIDLDVTHANNTKLFDPEKYGNIKLGQGTVIEYGQDKSRRINSIFRDIAKERNIMTQNNVSRIGGTNTEMFYLESADAETTLISLPLLSMHTPVETMDWRDIQATIDLLTETIISGQL